MAPAVFVLVGVAANAVGVAVGARIARLPITLVILKITWGSGRAISTIEPGGDVEAAEH